MRAHVLTHRRGYGRRFILMVVPLLAPLLALRDHLPVVPAPREDRGGTSWRPVLFGLGAAVGFAIALGRTRNVQAPGVVPVATPEGGQGLPGRVEHAIGRSIHLPSPLKDTIEAELSTDGPVLFSPLDAIDPIGTDGTDSVGESDDTSDHGSASATGAA